MKLVHVDIYERALREEVRRKRVARDYQLVSQYFAENPLIQFGVKISPLKMANLLKLKKQGSGGPKQELIEALMPYCQFNTCQEFKSLVDNICLVKELLKYREHGLMKVAHLVSFERERFKREIKKRCKSKKAGDKIARLLPSPEDYSPRAILNPEYETEPSQQRQAAIINSKKRKQKKGKRLLLSRGCPLTAPDSPASVSD